MLQGIPAFRSRRSRSSRRRWRDGCRQTEDVMLWQGRVTRASGDRPVRNRRVTPVAPPLPTPPTESGSSPSTRSYSGGAEAAGMKGWRGRSRIPPEGAKARFTRVSRGLAPQVSFFSSPCHHHQHIHSSIYGGVSNCKFRQRFSGIV